MRVEERKRPEVQRKKRQKREGEAADSMIRERTEEGVGAGRCRQARMKSHWGCREGEVEGRDGGEGEGG